MNLEKLKRLEATIVRGRRWIVAMDVLVPAASVASQLQKAGALDVMAIGASRGTGPLPAMREGRMMAMTATGEGMMGAMRAAETMLDAVTPEIESAINIFDPEGSARVIRALYSKGRPVAQRRTWGARPESWQALEDKTIIDEIWDRSGVNRVPVEVVPIEEATEISLKLDRGQGVVWAGDSRDGFNGGATSTRWIRNPQMAQEVLPFFRKNHDCLRIMPFLEGIPCSIHGIVFPDHVAALRPNEMVVFRRPERSEFVYAGFATFWDPPQKRREEMREVVRKVGAFLRSAYGYRGAFSVDGVMTTEGFLPTELNPRIGAALYVVFGREVSLDVFNGSLIEEEPLDWQSKALEAYLLDNADCNRGGGHGLVVQKAGPKEARLCLEGGVARVAEEGEVSDMNLQLGPGPAGGYLRMTPVAERTPVGTSVAPRVAAALKWADEAWDLGIGELEPAKSVL